MNSNRYRLSVSLTALALCLYAMPLSASVISECGGRLPSTVHLPDLMNIVPIHVHVQEAHQRHKLLFTVGIANVGEGPMELAPASSLTDPNILVSANQNLYNSPTNNSGSIVCKRSLAEAFGFHPDHNHWHLLGINGFDVRMALDNGSGGKWDTKKSIGSIKEGFCLLDYVQMNDDQLAAFGITLPNREYWSCIGVQGISTGWIDYYHHATHGQYVDITGAPAGIYYLVVTANPNKIFMERDYENNRAWVSFRLKYNNDNNAILSILYDSLNSVGEGLHPPNKTNK